MNISEIITTINAAVAEVEWEYPIDYAAALDSAIDALITLDQINSICVDNHNVKNHDMLDDANSFIDIDNLISDWNIRNLR